MKSCPSQIPLVWCTLEFVCILGAQFKDGVDEAYKSKVQYFTEMCLFLYNLGWYILEDVQHLWRHQCKGNLYILNYEQEDLGMLLWPKMLEFIIPSQK